MGYPVVHFEVIGKDAAALRTFYATAFGWKFDHPIEAANVQEYAVAHPEGGTGIDGGIGRAPDGYDGHVTFYIGVPDAAEALRTIESAGGKTMMAPQQVPGGPTIALFTDPEGHTVGLVQV